LNVLHPWWALLLNIDSVLLSLQNLVHFYSKLEKLKQLQHCNKLITISTKISIFRPKNQMLQWSWSYGSWIYYYLCNQCLSPLKLWSQIPFMAKCNWYNIMW
jgi:hypothetical protein